MTSQANLGIITDELTQDLGEALALLSSYGLRWCELREVWGRNVIGLRQADDVPSPHFAQFAPAQPVA